MHEEPHFDPRWRHTSPGVVKKKKSVTLKYVELPFVNKGSSIIFAVHVTWSEAGYIFSFGLKWAGSGTFLLILLFTARCKRDTDSLLATMFCKSSL